MILFDTHCHLDEEAFDVDRAAVVARAAEAAVGRLVTIGTTAPTSRRAVEIAALFENVYAAVGIQPNYVASAGPGDWHEIEQLATAPKVVAIGETGLDRYWDHTPIDAQVDYFDRHMNLARRMGLPFIVHCREAESDVLARLTAFAGPGGVLNGVMHSFRGSAGAARECVALGMHISFAGMVTYKKSQALRDVVKEVPLDRLLIETDAPYLAPQPMRGKRNEPAFLCATAECLAQVLEMPPEDLARATSANASRLFGLPL